MCQYSRKPEKGIRFPGTEDTGSFEMFDMGARDGAQVFRKDISVLKHLSHVSKARLVFK